MKLRQEPRRGVRGGSKNMTNLQEQVFDDCEELIYLAHRIQDEVKAGRPMYAQDGAFIVLIRGAQLTRNLTELIVGVTDNEQEQ